MPLCGERWRSGQLRLFNLFGTTEMSVWATAHEFSAHSPVPPAPLPVGAPLSATSVDLAADGAVVIRSASRHAFVNGVRIRCVTDRICVRVLIVSGARGVLRLTLAQRAHHR